MCSSAPAFCLLVHPSILLHIDNPYLFFVYHSYSLCCLCACNIHNASACSVHAKFLHNLSSLSDHHRDSLASLVLSTRSTSLYVIMRFLSLSGSLRLFVFSMTVELTFSVPVIGLNAHPVVNFLHKHLHSS
jgi:hypothetical protein